MFVIGAAGTVVSFMLPEQIEAGHVDFARQLAAKAWAYAVAVERRYRGLPPLPDVPVPYTLTAQGRGPARRRRGTAGPGAAARRAGGDGMTATAEVRFGADGAAKVQSYVRLTASTYIRCCTYADPAPILTIQDGPADITITNPGQGEVTEDDLRFGRLLAEAVNLYAAELEKLAAKDHATAADPGACRAGGVMERVMEAGRLELVPPAAPGFSPAMHERGDHRMRKVVTGEQVAQLYNPDPFALPGLAGPGLPHPARHHRWPPSSPGCWPGWSG